MNSMGASDMYVTVDAPIALRVDDHISYPSDQRISLDEVDSILNSILTARQKRTFDVEMELNTSLDMGELGRFRVNVMRQRQKPAIVIRRIVSKIPGIRDLRLPSILESLSLEKRGLILLTGVTGSGKSTTLASMIDYRNEREEGHIITIEDPIEYFHDHKRSIITQREVGVDTESYAIALKNALRQRPDVMLVGEIRDREVMEQAMMVTETGHLCLATIHTTNAYQAIERIVNLFPEELSSQVRMNLSMNLKAIISQRLIPSVDGSLVPAVEVLLNQGLVRELILKGEISKVRDVMEQNASSGMRSFDMSLLQLYNDGLISEETVITNSDKPSDMKIKLQQQKISKQDTSLTSALSGFDTSQISIGD
ncbi:MAG: type IV pili twitching motility protein PilT [Micavibrio sp.]|nr:type IV pili twitching motility protein PilT [Micavibrio sp.]|tara:strand:+ start:40 stop:1143 length:1104 start_codon:yes stop_codon:yes gene_type:complete